MILAAPSCDSFSRHFALLTALFILVATVTATPLPGNSDDYNCVRPGHSIQEAIDKARPGDRIVVEAGTYEEQLVIKTDGISLIGNGAILVPPHTPVPNLCTGLSEIEGNKTEAGICIHGEDIVLAPYQLDHRKIISVGSYVKDVHVVALKFADSWVRTLRLLVVTTSKCRTTNSSTVRSTVSSLLALQRLLQRATPSPRPA